MATLANHGAERTPQKSRSAQLSRAPAVIEVPLASSVTRQGLLSPVRALALEAGKSAFTRRRTEVAVRVLATVVRALKESPATALTQY